MALCRFHVKYIRQDCCKSSLHVHFVVCQQPHMAAGLHRMPRPQMPIRTFAAAAHFGLRMRLPVQIRPVRPDYPPFERRICIQAANRPPLSAADIACRLHLLLFRCFLTRRILTTANQLLGVPYFGASGTVEASALPTRVFKFQENVQLQGFSGLMLVITEDEGLAATHAAQFDIRALLTYTACAASISP